MNKCKYAVIDEEAKKRADEEYQAYLYSMPEEQREAVIAWEKQNDGENDPLSGCDAFCKYLKEGKGFPGEYVYGCGAPGNEKILHVDFNESEII